MNIRHIRDQSARGRITGGYYRSSNPHTEDSKTMSEIGTRKKRTVQEPLSEPRREPEPVRVPEKRPERRQKVAT